jgi:hypothetical protein
MNSHAELRAYFIAGFDYTPIPSHVAGSPPPSRQEALFQLLTLFAHGVRSSGASDQHGVCISYLPHGCTFYYSGFIYLPERQGNSTNCETPRLLHHSQVRFVNSRGIVVFAMLGQFVVE